MLEYLKTYLVKSYLILNTNANVQFASSEHAMDTEDEKSDKHKMI